MPRFLTTAQRDGYKLCARLMVGIFGDEAQASLDRPEFSVVAGSARIDVIVTPWRDSFVATVQSVVVAGPNLDYNLLEFLLTENALFDLGAFGLDKGGNVQFRRAILGPSLTETELRASVQYLMLIADQYDDRIQSRWGGQRASDSRPMPSPPHRRQLRVKMQTGVAAADETVQVDSDDIDYG